MSDTETSEPEGGWEPWMDNPFAIEQPERTVLLDVTSYQMQSRQSDGSWEPFNNPRTDRDEITMIQAFHLNKDPEDRGLRVLRKQVIWTVDEVPGRGEGQTPPEVIIARNEENKKKLTAEDEQPNT
jgi:hypothetical protein